MSSKSKQKNKSEAETEQGKQSIPSKSSRKIGEATEGNAHTNPVEEDFVHVPSDGEEENGESSASQPKRDDGNIAAAPQTKSRGKIMDKGGTGEKSSYGEGKNDSAKTDEEKNGDRRTNNGKPKIDTANPRVPQVLHIFENSGSDAKAKVTLEYEPFATKGTQLGAVRSKLDRQMTKLQSFCYRNGSEVADSLLLATYLATTESEVPNDVDDDTADGTPLRNNSFLPNKLYITGARNLSGGDILLHPPFVINIAKWQADGSPISQGSLHSNTFGNAKVAELTLAGLRKRVSNMSRLPSVHKFCTPGGVTIEDESLTLTDYLSIESVQSAGNDKNGAVPSVVVLFKLNLPSNQPKVTPTIPDSIKATPELNKDLMSGAKEAAQFTQKTRADITDAPAVASGTDLSKAAGYLTEGNWNEVIRNCGIMYGWVVNRATNSISRAPKAAFKLKAKGGPSNSLATIPDFVKATVPSTSNVSTAPTTTPTEIKLESIKDTKISADPVFSIGQRADKTVPPATLSPQASGTAATSQTGPSPTGGGIINQPDPAATSGGTTNQTSTDSSAQTAGASSSAVDGSSPNPSTPSPGVSTDTTIVAGKVTSVMPSFQVNDNSRIDIMACEHEFETSMARNDFSSQSTEASMSGGWGGFSVSVSAGYSSSKSNTSKTTDNTYQKTMVAKYLFPRADLFLDPDDLEPTPELAQLLQVIAKNKNIKDLRKLQAEFGQLFCQSVTVGGRLLSTKIMQSAEHGTEEEQKEQFKVSVGVSVQTPIGVGAEMKHDEEHGTSTSTNTTSKTTNEDNVFEAVGGDTILASNPAAWATTVGDYRTWRVINREGLLPLSTIISSIQGYEHVRDYFVQAVPALSKYIELDEGRQVKTRLRLTSPMHGLSYCDSTNPAYYLSHAPGGTATPKLMYLEGTTSATAWGNNNDPFPSMPKLPLFHPASFHAPVIQGYESNMVGSQPYGVDYDQSFVNSMWTITSPFNEALQHEGRVILQTVPLSRQPGTGASTLQAPDPVSLVVFRNQQGVFLPGMSSISDYQYWRILKVGSTTPGENLQEGDEITLAWAFSDQTAGYRDYTDDIFGRRRNHCPHELENEVLYLKLPWPRFESLRNGQREANCMLLSPNASSKPVPTLLRCLSEKGGGHEVENMYLLEEVKFRIDTVANDGLGDTEDYLLKGIAEKEGGSVPPIVGALEARQRLIELNMLTKMFFL